MLDAVAVAQNNKRLGPGSSASGLLTDPKPIPKTNSQTLNLDVPAITNLNLIPSVPVLPRPPYRFHPGVYSRHNAAIIVSIAAWSAFLCSMDYKYTVRDEQRTLRKLFL